MPFWLNEVNMLKPLVVTLLLLAFPAVAGWNGTCPTEGVGAYQKQPAAQGTGIIRLSDNKWFAENPNSTDWNCYVLWVAAGNTPLPAAP